MLDHSIHGEPGRAAVVLLHAGGMTRREWDPFVPALSARYRLVVPSAIGHGASPTVSSFTLDDLVSSTVALLDSLGISRAHLVGSSMGAATALRLALAHPERVDRLVLYRSGYRSSPVIRKALENMAAPEMWERWGLRRWMEREHGPQGGSDAWMEVIRKVARAFDASRPDASIRPADLERLSAPTLLISGDRDPLVPLEDVLEMYRRVPDCGIWIVPRAEHVMGMETWRRACFLGEIDRFLAG